MGIKFCGIGNEEVCPCAFGGKLIKFVYELKRLVLRSVSMCFWWEMMYVFQVENEKVCSCVSGGK